MAIRLDMLPATYGDCLLLSYGDPVRHVLIDAGTPDTWEDHLRGHLEREGVERLELFVMTHIDEDHIGGAIPMLEDPRCPTIGEVWFNGPPNLRRLLSRTQGEQFSRLIRERDLPWNQRFQERPVCVEHAPKPIEFNGGLRLTVLSPTHHQLKRLRAEWQKKSPSAYRDLLSIGRGRSRRQQYLARRPTTSTDVPRLATQTRFKQDTSKPNGSSIALLAEHGRSKVLLTGDAYPRVLQQAIRDLRPSGERLKLGALKVSHHGSRGNTSQEMLEMLDCKRYLISCNGAVHKLPDNETVARIIHYGGAKPQLYFNYDCDRTKVWSSPDLQKRYRYEARYGEEGFFRLDV